MNKTVSSEKLSFPANYKVVVFTQFYDDILNAFPRKTEQPSLKRCAFSVPSIRDLREKFKSNGPLKSPL